MRKLADAASVRSCSAIAIVRVSEMIPVDAICFWAPYKNVTFSGGTHSLEGDTTVFLLACAPRFGGPQKNS